MRRIRPIVDTAAIWLGIEEGIFAEHGLDVSLAIRAGGAAVVESLEVTAEISQRHGLLGEDLALEHALP